MTVEGRFTRLAVDLVNSMGPRERRWSRKYRTQLEGLTTGDMADFLMTLAWEEPLRTLGRRIWSVHVDDIATLCG